MVKRTIYIGNPTYIRIHLKQLELIDPATQLVKGKMPIEDIAFLILDNYQITINTKVLFDLMENNVAVITTDDKHMPFAIMQPFAGHSEHSDKIKKQIAVSDPLKKQLWKQTILSKIQNQKNVLIKYDRDFKKMDNYLSLMQSGDITNMEGKAAKYYWMNLWDDFTRDRFGSEPNNMLNYGYSILRSIVARALVGSGLLTVLGIFHQNKYNPHCLADDIMEPYRPFVDMMVYEYIRMKGCTEIIRMEEKKYLLSIPTIDVVIKKKKRPLMIAVTDTTASLSACYEGKKRVIDYPIIEIK